MRQALAILLAVVALGCAPGPRPSPEAPPPEAPSPAPAAEGEDTCGLARYRHLLGKHESEISPSDLPPRARIICPQCMVTQDYRPDRLNLFTNTEGRVSSMRCF
jgi:hypothetical protein